jgi:hypothetical protein
MKRLPEKENTPEAGRLCDASRRHAGQDASNFAEINQQGREFVNERSHSG